MESSNPPFKNIHAALNNYKLMLELGFTLDNIVTIVGHYSGSNNFIAVLTYY